MITFCGGGMKTFPPLKITVSKGEGLLCLVGYDLNHLETYGNQHYYNAKNAEIELPVPIFRALALVSAT